MKTCMRVVCISVTVLCTIMFARPATGQDLGSGYFPDSGGIQPFMADAPGLWPGRVWVQANLADSGLGYTGTYFTLGWKSHWFQDFLDGRWLVETRGHLSAESGGFFGNLGLERVFSLHAAEAEITCGIWADFDNDLQGDFAHDFSQLSVNASIETRHWLINGNGYFPVGEVDYLTGTSCFLNNVLVTQHGLDSAMQGFDGLVQFKPQPLQHINGTVGLGGYGYESELVDFFGGIRGRLGFQTNKGLIVNAEINHDNRFDLTGVIQLGFLFGAGAKGTEYGMLGNDLEPTIRNDHIVRVQRDLRLAIDPDTGRPYDVYHVNNLATPGGDGSFERPFDELKDAEMSAPDAIIFVNEGGGTTRGMDEAIVLKDGQLLLGDGVRHLIPLADGTNFVLCNDIDGNRPRITNNNFGNAVTLANRNTVRGFIIDGTDGGMINGISGDGLARGSTIFDGIIEDVTITGTLGGGEPILNGIFLRDIGGDWTFARNEVELALIDGIAIFDACDPTSVFVFDSNNVSDNSRDGIHIEDYLADELIFRNNTTDRNGRNGIHIEGFKGDP
ncbi:MAG: right-handed parallel beta-helix repeat-containing protein, partial [Pirellulaceae bacterium]